MLDLFLRSYRNLLLYIHNPNSELMSISQRLAVFPLPVFLLPGGITKLRIFEPRYIRMVKESAESGFALSVYNKALPDLTSNWAAKVDIIDFETLPDGMLGIVIKAKYMVALSNIKRDEDNLASADTTQIEHWPDLEELETEQGELSVRLQHVVEQNKQLADLYQNPMYGNEPNWNSITWVCRRWLEVLPISYQCRKDFVDPGSFKSAQDFIKTMVLGDAH